MILQSLYEYHQRKPSLPREGWIAKEIDFVAVVDAQGNCQALNSMIERVGTRWVGKTYEVPAIGPQAPIHPS